MDKTGTLTLGTPCVMHVEGPLPEHLGAVISLLAVNKIHPIAQAVAKWCQNLTGNMQCDELILRKYLPGRGIEATTARGAVLRFGSLAWLDSLQLTRSSLEPGKMRRLAGEGCSLVGYARDAEILVVFAVRDSIAPGARSLMQALRGMDLDVVILSGDDQAVVDSVARDLDIDPRAAHGNLYPEAKAAMVQAHARHSAMVGDGVNDALALQAASVGIGLKGGIEAIIESADAYISSGSIAEVKSLFIGARRTLRVIRNNLLMSVVYNTSGGVLAIAGYMDPLIAAVLMPLSSITVIAYALSAKTFER